SERQSLPLDPPLTEYQQKKPANLTQRLIKLFRQLSSRRGQEGPLTIQQLANYGEEKLSEIIKHTIHRLSKQFPEEIREHQDALRALILLNSSDFELANVG